jgi:hypothetical protein
MGKLHEALAVHGSLKTTADNMLKEASKSFKDKSHLYTGHVKTYSPLNDNDSEKLEDEIKHLVDNVPAKLKYIQDSVIETTDCMYQKEATNTIASADIVIDGVVIAKEVPAVVLLNLETQLKAVRSAYNDAPTLEPSQSWSKDETADDVYVTAPHSTHRTKKISKPVRLAEATEFHPEQVQMVTEDVVVGYWKNVQKSGCLSPKDKHKYLKRIDNLIRAIVKARTKANDMELKEVNIGKDLFDYINNIN